MVAVAALARPRRAFAAAAERPALHTGLAAVVVTGVLSAGIDVSATVLGGGGNTGLVLSGLLPAFFAGYWLLDAWLVEAGAAMLGRGGRRRRYLAVSGLAFPSLISYALLLLLEAAAGRWMGPALSSALAWLTLPVLVWFLALIVLSVRAVYQVPTLNAFALALLPYAAITTALVVTLLVLAVLHGAGVI